MWCWDDWIYPSSHDDSLLLHCSERTGDELAVSTPPGRSREAPTLPRPRATGFGLGLLFETFGCCMNPCTSIMFARGVWLMIVKIAKTETVPGS